MAFDPPEGLMNRNKYPDYPPSNDDARAQVQSPSNQLRDFVNEILLPEVDNAVNTAPQRNFGVATGTANNYVVTLDYFPDDYYDGMVIGFRLDAPSNTGASVINVMGKNDEYLGAIPIMKSNGNNVTEGDLHYNGMYTLRYNGETENFFLQGSNATGNATPAQVLSGRTFTNDNGSQVGTMPNRGAYSITPGTSQITIPNGYHSGGGVVASLGGNATPAQVFSGSTFSSNSAGRAVAGTMRDCGAYNITPGTANITIPSGYHNGGGVVASIGGNATPAQVLAGSTFGSNSAGRLATGTMPNRGTQTITPSTSNITIPAGYHNGSGYVVGDADLVPSKILRNVNLFGVTGTVIEDPGPLFSAVQYIDVTIPEYSTSAYREVYYNINSVNVANSFVCVSPLYDGGSDGLRLSHALFTLESATTIKVRHARTPYSYVARVFICTINTARVQLLGKGVTSVRKNGGYVGWSGYNPAEANRYVLYFSGQCEASLSNSYGLGEYTPYLPVSGTSVYFYVHGGGGSTAEFCDFGSAVLYIYN